MTKKGEDKLETNIDKHHDDVIDEYNHQIKYCIPKLIIERKNIKKLLKSKQASLSLIDNIEYADRLIEIKKMIHKIKSDHIKYLLSTSECVFEYYADKQKTELGNNLINKNTVKDFFNITPESNTTTNDDTTIQLKQPIISKYTDSKYIYQKYWNSINGNVLYTNDYLIKPSICLSCEKGELISQEDEGTLNCNNPDCGIYITHITDNQKPVHKEMPNEIYSTTYIRLNHFKEIITQFQGQQTTKIPEDIMEAIGNRIKKERLDVKSLNYLSMRHILSTLNLSIYMDHIYYINSMFGVHIPIMDNELKETLYVLFIEIQQPWALYCPPERKNFFNYTYVLYQLCYILDQHQFLPYISITTDREMKDRIKQLQQDVIWKDVCRHLDWEYHPTV